MTSLKCYFRAKVHFSGTCREKVGEGKQLIQLGLLEVGKVQIA